MSLIVNILIGLTDTLLSGDLTMSTKNQGQIVMERRAQARLRPRLHIKRWEILVEIKEPGQTETKKIEGRISLTDFGPLGACVFTNFAVTIDSEVTFTFPEPEPTLFKGKIIYCHEHNLNRKVLSDSAFRFRIGIELKHDNPEQKAKTLQLYLKAAHGHLLVKKKRPVAA